MIYKVCCLVYTYCLYVSNERKNGHTNFFDTVFDPKGFTNSQSKNNSLQKSYYKCLEILQSKHKNLGNLIFVVL